VADTEQRLIWLARSGDKEAFSELVALFESRVYRAAYALTGNEQDARDLSQETFISAYRGIGRFRGKSSFFTWLYRILLNTFKSSLRRKKTVREEISGDERAADVTSRSASEWEKASQREIVDRAYKAISSLPHQQRMVIVMRCLEEMTYREIAQAMRCSIGTVKSRIHAARLSLKQQLLGQSEVHRVGF
jgi:RNA polymerase sigma-70 factor (ECF subfamily)